MRLQNDVGRSCGECNACCKVFAVPEVEKNDQDWCRHCERGVGCKIYKQRPFACKEFACVWLNGLGGDKHRPDRLGAMVDSMDFIFPGGRSVCIVHVWELDEGALLKPYINELTKLNIDAGNIVWLHGIETVNSYWSRIRASQNHFTAADMLYLRTTLTQKESRYGHLNVYSVRNRN